MKKILSWGCIVTGGIILLSGVVSKEKTAATAYTVISSADGPTSVFIAGKIGDLMSWAGIAAGVIILLLGLFGLKKISEKKNGKDKTDE